MLDSPLLPFALPDCIIDRIRLAQDTYHIDAHCAAHAAVCPDCHQESVRVHSWYRRQPRDLPMSTCALQLSLRIRRFFCTTRSCGRTTFAEQVPALLPAFAQRTSRLTQALQTIGHALGGQAGARLAQALQMPTSHDTVLRTIQTTPLPAASKPRVIGIDDFAFKKGCSYGTIIVDLERRQPIDLLPDRTADVVATWLQDHPSVGVIARDRSNEYARGCANGAPHAQQVLDRWHLLKNQRDALERLLTRVYAELRQLPALGSHAPWSAVPQSFRGRSRSERVASERARTTRLQQYQAVQTLVKQGVPLLRIARQLRISRTMTIKFARTPVFPERAPHRRQPRALDPYEAYLHQQWASGCTNARQLWRDIQAQGFPAGYRQVAKWATFQRRRVTAATRLPDQMGAEIVPVVQQRTLPSPSQLAWLLMRAPAALDPAEQALVTYLQQHPVVCQAQGLAQTFTTVMREQALDRFERWLETCLASPIPELQIFAKNLHQDGASSRAAVSEPWSTGQCEGQITRLKYLKRAMYGRASFALLRHRVLYREATFTKVA